MKFSFSPSSTDLEKVEEGTQLLLGDIKSEKELEIQVEFQENVPLTIARNGDHLHITCQEPAHYYRGLNWAVHHPEDTWNTKSEPVYFSKNGVMLDCSRNAVFTVEKVKSYCIRKTSFHIDQFFFQLLTAAATARMRSARWMLTRELLASNLYRVSRHWPIFTML